MVLDRVLAQVQMFGDIPVPLSHNHQRDDLCLPLGERYLSPYLPGQPRTLCGEGLQQIVKLLAIRPDLVPMHLVNAFAKSFARIFPLTDSRGSAAERLDEQTGIVVVKQHYAVQGTLVSLQITQNIKARPRTIFKISTDESHVGHARQSGIEIVRAARVAKDLCPIAGSVEHVREKLAAHLRCLEDDHVRRCRRLTLHQAVSYTHLRAHETVL